MNEIKYDQDFYGWTQEQARLLREGRFSEVDIGNVVEEIETGRESEPQAAIGRDHDARLRPRSS